MATSAAVGAAHTTPDVSGFDLTDIVSDAQTNGCECDVCEAIRSLAETRELQGTRWTAFRRGIVVAAIFSPIAALLALVELLVDVL